MLELGLRGFFKPFVELLECKNVGSCMHRILGNFASRFVNGSVNLFLEPKFSLSKT